MPYYNILDEILLEQKAFLKEPFLDKLIDKLFYHGKRSYRFKFEQKINKHKKNI